MNFNFFFKPSFYITFILLLFLKEGYKDWSAKCLNSEENVKMNYLKEIKTLLKDNEELKKKEKQLLKKLDEMEKDKKKEEQKSIQLLNQLNNSFIEKDILIIDKEKDEKKILELNNQIMNLKTGIFYFYIKIVISNIIIKDLMKKFLKEKENIENTKKKKRKWRNNY